MTRTQLVTGIAVVVALAVVGLFFIFNPFASQNTLNPLDTSATSSTGAAGLVVQDELIGTGATAQPGDLVVVQYTGKLDNGTVFDTSVGKPAISSITPCPPGTQTGICFNLGAGQVIPGWDQGLVGMQVGGKRVLIIPPSLGYGAQAVGPIPANATLTFEVELLSVTPAAGASQYAPEGPAAQ